MSNAHEGVPGGSRRRHALAVLGSLALSAAILAWLWIYKDIRAGDLLERWRQADKLLLTAVVALSVAFHVFVGAHKLWCIVRALGLKMTYREMLCVRLGAGPLRAFVPKVGELVTVFYFWRRKRMAFGRASGASVFDKGLNFVGAVFWLLVALALLPDAWPDGWATHWHLPLGGGVDVPLRQVLFVGVTVGYLLGFFCTPVHALLIRAARRVHPKVGRLVEGILAPFHEFSFLRKVFFTSYGIIFQLRDLVVCYFLFHAFSVSPVPSPAYLMMYTSVAIFAGHIGGFAGMGPRETVIVTLFARYASPGTLLSIGLMLTLAVHVIPMLVGLPWMVWFLAHLRHREAAGAGPGPLGP